LSTLAVEYWQRAGHRAVGRSANVEAVEHFTRGLALLQNLPTSDERDRIELGLQAALVPALIATRGHAAPETARAVTRAGELCERLQDPGQVFPMLFGVWVVHLVAGEYEKAREQAEQCLRLAEGKQDPALLVFAP
jgi:predicted ATPase